MLRPARGKSDTLRVKIALQHAARRGATCVRRGDAVSVCIVLPALVVSQYTRVYVQCSCNERIAVLFVKLIGRTRAGRLYQRLLDSVHDSRAIMSGRLAMTLKCVAVLYYLRQSYSINSEIHAQATITRRFAGHACLVFLQHEGQRPGHHHAHRSCVPVVQKAAAGYHGLDIFMQVRLAGLLLMQQVHYTSRRFFVRVGW